MRYYIEIDDDGKRTPAGREIGYDTLKEAKEAAKDAWPKKVRVLAHVATAYAEDGGKFVREEK